jgi:hypothetical protein
VIGDGEPVLTIHGDEGGFDQGLDMTGALAGHGYQLISVPFWLPSLDYARRRYDRDAGRRRCSNNILTILASTRWQVAGISAGAWGSIVWGGQRTPTAQVLFSFDAPGTLATEDGT